MAGAVGGGKGRGRAYPSPNWPAQRKATRRSAPYLPGGGRHRGQGHPVVEQHLWPTTRGIANEHEDEVNNEIAEREAEGGIRQRAGAQDERAAGGVSSFCED